jgi:hypothetical protein
MGFRHFIETLEECVLSLVLLRLFSARKMLLFTVGKTAQDYFLHIFLVCFLFCVMISDPPAITGAR